MQCSTCGKSIDETGAKFCRFCGGTLVDAQIHELKSGTEPRKGIESDSQPTMVEVRVRSEKDLEHSEREIEETPKLAAERATEEQTRKAISILWQRYRPLCLERLSVLETATVNLLKGPIEDQLRRKAEAEAHKLAGTLGTYGFPSGSKDARDAEVLLQTDRPLEQRKIFRLSELVLNLRTLLESQPPSQIQNLEGVPSAPSESITTQSVRQEGTQSAEPVDVAVVEDDEALAGLLLQVLKTQGYSTEWFTDGEVALNALGKSTAGTAAKLIVLDVNLPSLDGISILRQLSRQGTLKKTKVIMLTVRSAEPEILSTLQLGAFDHVAKPVSVPVLMERIKRALES